MAGIYLSEAPRSPPPLHTVGIHVPHVLIQFIHTGKGGGDEPVRKVRGALVHKRGLKYQRD